MNTLPRLAMVAIVYFAINTLSFGLTKIQKDSINSGLILRNKANELRYKFPDSSIALLEQSFKVFINENDTIQAANSLLAKAHIFENNANYSKSYDAYWSALMLTDNFKNDNIKSLIYHRLGRIYSYYKREDDALKYLNKALLLRKHNIEEEGLNKSELIPYYYFIASTYRELNKPNLAKTYVDSCYQIMPEKLNDFPKALVHFEKAYVLSKTNKETEAIKLLEDIYPWFKKNNPSYLVLFYKQLADIYLDLNKLNVSEDLYMKSLAISKEYNSHKDFIPLVHEKLSNMYLKKNDFKNAFKHLELAKQLNELFFDSRSSNNQSLLEIKDNYRIEKLKQEARIQAQYLKQLEQEDEISNLERIILLVSIVFIAVLAFIYVKHLRAKHNAEKVLIKKNQELENKKTQELLELKNKELAASALQLIEKEEFLKTLKSKVRVKDEKIKVHEVNKVLRSISVSNNQNWEEFKLRFIDVNKDFYKKMFDKFPNLSQGDQKICALIKLNFSSKDMARLLGISVESVHTSRHRIRKKMKLSRSVNLEDYINSL